MKKQILIKRKTNVVAREIGNTITILNPKSGVIYSLNDTASCIWKFLYKKRSLPEITDRLCSAFNIVESVARKDALKFIEDCITNRLITKVS